MPASQLQPLSHFSQSGHFQYIAATNPSYQNTSFTHTSATFQPQRIAYGLQPGSIQVATPVHTAYIARPPRPMEQRSPPVGYGLLHTSIPAYNSQLQTPSSTISSPPLSDRQTSGPDSMYLAQLPTLDIGSQQSTHTGLYMHTQQLF